MSTGDNSDWLQDVDVLNLPHHMQLGLEWSLKTLQNYRTGRTLVKSESFRPDGVGLRVKDGYVSVATVGMMSGNVIRGCLGEKGMRGFPV